MGGVLIAMIFLPLAAAAAVLCLGERRPGAVRGLTLATTIVVFALIVLVVARFQPTTGGEGPIRPQMVVRADWITLDLPSIGGAPPGKATLEFFLGIDGISLWLVALTGFMMIPAVLISWKSVTEEVTLYHFLLLILETSLLGVFCAFDVMLFYIFFEFTLIPLYFLIGKWGGPRKRYAAGKFFIYTLTGSLLGLVGLVSLVVVLASQEQRPMTFSIPEIARGIDRQVRLAEGLPLAEGEKAPKLTSEEREARRAFWKNAQWWIFLALFAGFAIKVPLIPFHTWLPIVHVEAPTAGSVQLATVLLKLGTYGFLRLCLPLVPYGVLDPGVPLIAVLSAVGIVYGALCALAQSDIKKLVAYSSVSHLGFCMLGMFALNDEGITGSVIQSINHGLSTGALFLLIGMIYERYHTRDMRALGGLGKRLPLLSVFFVFICLSSAGLPGLNGFVGEMLTIVGMYRLHPFWAMVGALSVVLGAWYLFTLMQGTLFGPLREPEGFHEPVRDMDGREWWTIAPIAAVCLWIGVYPRPFMDAMRPEVEAVTAIYDRLDKIAADADEALAGTKAVGSSGSNASELPSGGD